MAVLVTLRFVDVRSFWNPHALLWRNRPDKHFGDSRSVPQPKLFASNNYCEYHQPSVAYNTRLDALI